MIDHPHVGKGRAGKGPRTSKARRRALGLDRAQREAEQVAKRQRGDTRRALEAPLAGVKGVHQPLSPPW